MIHKAPFGDSGTACIVTGEPLQPGMRIDDTWEYLLPNSRGRYWGRVDEIGIRFDSTPAAADAPADAMPALVRWLKQVTPSPSAHHHPRRRARHPQRRPAGPRPHRRPAPAFPCQPRPGRQPRRQLRPGRTAPHPRHLTRRRHARADARLRARVHHHRTYRCLDRLTVNGAAAGVAGPPSAVVVALNSHTKAPRHSDDPASPYRLQSALAGLRSAVRQAAMKLPVATSSGPKMPTFCAVIWKRNTSSFS